MFKMLLSFLFIFSVVIYNHLALFSWNWFYSLQSTCKLLHLPSPHIRRIQRLTLDDCRVCNDSLISWKPVLSQGDGRAQSSQESFFSSRWNWDSPIPSHAGECAPLLIPGGGGGHIPLRERGGGEFQFGREDRHCGTLGTYICTLCVGGPWYLAALAVALAAAGEPAALHGVRVRLLAAGGSQARHRLRVRLTG